MVKMSESESDLPVILDLLVSVGYSQTGISSKSASEKLTGGLAWAIAAINPQYKEDQMQVLTTLCSGKRKTRKHSICTSYNEITVSFFINKVGESIEAAVQSIGCPYPLQAQQIQGLDYKGIYPVIKWIVNRVQLVQVRAQMGDEDQESKESDFHSHCTQRLCEIQTKVLELENEILSSNENRGCLSDVDHHLSVSMENLNSAKSELAAKLRENLLQRRQLGDVPSQVELIQYGHRFSELYVQIQEKLRQTHKYYGTYNVLLEIKELMLKETSLLNSISSQFQNAMMTTVGRSKLIKSMEGILKGIQQKLDKVQITFQSEQILCDNLKQKHAAAVVEQRHRSSLLKAFQEEYARSQRLWSSTAM